MSARNLLLLALAVVATLLLSSCSFGPPSQFIDTGPSYEQAISDVRAVSIIGDVCLRRDSSAGDYIMVYESKSAGSYLIRGAGDYLGKKGYLVSSRLSPFVGAFKGRATTWRVADRRDSEITDRSAPFFVSPEVADDPSLEEALKRIITAVRAAVGQDAIPPHRVFSSTATVRGDLLTIGDHVGSAYVLVAIVDGESVSGAKSSAQGCLTGAATSVLTGGLVSVSVEQCSNTTSYVALIDLASGELLWSNTVEMSEGDPTSVHYYGGIWAAQLLHHLPSRGLGS